MSIKGKIYQFKDAGHGIPDGQHLVAEADFVGVYYCFPKHKTLSKAEFELLKADRKAIFLQ
jgi:hypothetical protein